MTWHRIADRPRDRSQTDQSERQRVLTLAREGKQRGWWQQYALPYATYVGLEAEAASISEYDSDLVAGAASS